ncbi:hypothetical protein B0T19DRAFT_75774 [Cercophora scortea]|uniref:Zn(2)-C6 fungal-type domain-containing protein n=1 Tax=Cercophora scortea TaxID=314031 RepID=A0AAE0J5U9_9PEZI|nr:hypothetical protein B0T19DRAFT_75774 [Cercophora scortea]
MAGENPPEGHKRKRDGDDNNNSDRIPQPPPPLSGNGALINYLSKSSTAKLPLIQGDCEAFTDVLALMGDYEGVLSRHESLAANLGAKLTAPRLLRAMEGLFEGAITVSPQSPFKDSLASTWYTPSWLDIVGFAASNPNDFALTTTADGRRICQFPMKNVRVEISEDDWRLIVSGALDRFRMVPPHPLEEDEVAELATIEILEQRLQTLIKKADEVARKARQLNYHLSGRKAVITARRSSPQSQGPGFQTINQPKPRSASSNPGYDLHADLLQQFHTPTPQPTAQVLSRPPSITSVPTPTELARPRPMPAAISTSQQQTHTALAQSSRPSPTHTLDSPISRDVAPRPSSAEDASSAHRPLIQARIDKLARGNEINPPCDRCRRLKTTCIKHLTACQGCTRKHAKCSWKGVTDAEIITLRGELVYAGGAGTPARIGGDAYDERDERYECNRKCPRTTG